MNRFKPRLDVLPEAQRRLWLQLAQTPRLGFVLYGGTAIALRLGHRPSIDFDFFTDKPLDRENCSHENWLLPPLEKLSEFFIAARPLIRRSLRARSRWPRPRSPTRQRHMQSLGETTLSAALAPSALARYMAEGARLDEAAVCALGLAAPPRAADGHGERGD